MRNMTSGEECGAGGTWMKRRRRERISKHELKLHPHTKVIANERALWVRREGEVGAHKQAEVPT